MLTGGIFLLPFRDPATGQLKNRFVEVGSAVRRLKEDEAKYFEEFNDSRENSDNNDYGEKKKITINTTGLFRNSGVSFFAMVTEVGDDTLKVQRFSAVPQDFGVASLALRGYRSPLFPNLLTTAGDNVVMVPTGLESELRASCLSLEQRFDMHSSLAFLDSKYAGHRLLNIHKFGSLWSAVIFSGQ